MPPMTKVNFSVAFAVTRNSDVKVWICLSSTGR